MDRRRCCASLVALLAAQSARPAALDRVAVQCEAVTPWAALPLRLAQRLGFTAQERVELRWVTSADAEGSESSAVPGLRVGPFDRLVRWVLAGGDARIVAGWVRSPQFAVGLAPATPDSQPWRLGVPHDRQLWASLAGMVLQRGWSRKAVLWQPLADAAEAEAALASGSVQGLAWGDPLLTRLERAGRLHVLADLRHPLQGQRWLGGPLLCTVLAAPSALWDAQAALLQRVARALRRALAWLQEASAMDLAPHADLAGLAHDRVTFLQVLERLRPSYSLTGSVDAQAVHQSLRLLASLPGGVVDQGFDPQRLLPPRGWAGA
ncbi:hypothetical protein Talka_00304 [Tepidimonas alkaliphilus]|uniref:SsuA/THI5-like domain-containing protein n=1 Tax=Tepidimonas alkaliphilus TaxID=2588942 RepID=A0A554WDH5_9BURK|nr:hypothetical protein [Tepidimonas alkaliphilus]TSE21628.1 hypothetical protein Talka_00304 [Tepidimonas alkaliphilus]